MRKAKISLGLAALYIGAQILVAEVTAYVYDGKNYDKEEITMYPRGRIVEFTNKEEFCKSWVIGPGVSILPNYILIPFYMLWLFYLFLGINIISDVFMAAIEVITS
jgi:hypothetical protein